MPISFTSKGSWKKSEAFLLAMQKLDIMAILNKHGAAGVAALQGVTPQDTGAASQSWYYKVERKGSSYSIFWGNTDVEGGFPVLIMLQFGHATGTGGYVQGYDFINPAIRPIFDQIEADVRKAVTSA